MIFVFHDNFLLLPKPIIAIIGAGIAGLTLAHTLENRKIDWVIFEGAPALQPVGAGLLLAINAMRVYQQLNLAQDIQRKGHRIDALQVVDPKFEPITNTDLRPFARAYDAFSCAIRRSVLSEILLSRLPAERIRLGKQLTGIEQHANSCTLHFKDGQRTRCGYIIGADGINSTVRRLAFQSRSFRQTNQRCWRGIKKTKLPPSYRHRLTECWIGPVRVGFCPVTTDTVYWFVTTTLNTGSKGEQHGIWPYLSQLPSFVQSFLQSNDFENAHFTSLYDLHPSKEWFRGRIALLGDAIHPTTPNLGQGAGQAIESAYVLGCLTDPENITATFQRYVSLRQSKTESITQTSYRIGMLAHWSQPWLVWIRNYALRRTVPDFVTRKQMERLFSVALLD